MADFKKLKDGQGNSYNVKDDQARENLASHTSNTSNPHSVTKAQVGLGNVDNTSDANKPISNAQALVNEAKFDKANVKATPGSTPSDDNVVSEKYSEETYGKKDGNYPTMTVGAADNLTPYDESAGADQNEPFSFQATGTGNGTQADFATGALALMKEKRGNSVVVNQHITDATTTQSWTIDNSAGGSSVYGSHSFDFASGKSALIDHYYIVIAQGTWSVTGDGVALLYVNNVNNQGTVFNFKAGVKTNLVKITSVQTPNATTQFFTQVGAGTTLTFNGSIKCVDITQWFGSNSNIPSDLLTHDSNFFRYYQGSLAYNTGQIVNANSRYIKCIGKQQWDEEADVTGSNLYSKNLIKVIPNNTYYFSNVGTDVYITLGYYDNNENLIGYAPTNTIHNGVTFTIPSNCIYIRFWLDSGYGTTYNHDITISIYYEGESGYDQYYPYEVLTNNDTGNEELKSAGNVADYKTPDGVITHKVDDLSFEDLTFTAVEDNDFTYYVADMPDDSAASKLNGIDALCDIYLIHDGGLSEMPDKRIMVNNTGWSSGKRIVIKDSSLTSASNIPNATLYYELATPTTEQGTPFSENLVIDDFGSMEFAGTSGVPQDNLIFYPVDYKAFVDTLYGYADGTPSNIALKTDVSTVSSKADDIFAIMKENVGGALRHQLADNDQDLDFANTKWVDLGELTWSYDSIYNFLYATVADLNTEKVLCPLYNNIGLKYDSQMADVANNSIAEDGNYIKVKNTSYTDATTFKAAMKGVLLAYEKASE